MLAALLRKIKEPEEAVERVIKTLGLETCANTYCGSPMNRGISGGEKKRTSIGVEIVSGPKLLFLDEPTSGLDSFASYNCVKTLKELVSAGNTVAVTIHQPSSELFYLFDNAIFLCQGDILYQGPVADVAEWFTEMGYPNPPNYNVCDHVTFLMQTLSKDAIATLRNSSTKKQSTIVNEGQPGTDTENPSDMVKMKPGHEEYKFSRKSSFCVQLKHLFLREVRDVYRDKGTLIARLALVVFLNVLIGLIFRDAGDNTLAAYTPEAHFGALTMISVSTMIGSGQPELLRFPLSRPVFIREYASGLYSTTSFFLSKTLVDIPMSAVQVSLVFLITYWSIGLHGVWPNLMLSAWMLSLCASSSALVIGCLVSDIKKGMEAAPLILVPQILFAGFFIRIAQMPIFIQWAQYLCFLKYGLNLIMIFEFEDPIRYDCQTGRCEAGGQLLSRNEIERDHWWLYACILIVMFIAFRILSLIALSFKGREAIY
eukprot:GEMP01035570.1.p1 GENE.GEMP01035570.1~~GEMP01035570.1.p1  ORF type:complete len:484 (+),score=76.87 GEMP01035570.1:226-1677(+)